MKKYLAIGFGVVLFSAVVYATWGNGIYDVSQVVVKDVNSENLEARRATADDFNSIVGTARGIVKNADSFGFDTMPTEDIDLTAKSIKVSGKNPHNSADCQAGTIYFDDSNNHFYGCKDSGIKQLDGSCSNNGTGHGTVTPAPTGGFFASKAVQRDILTQLSSFLPKPPTKWSDVTEEMLRNPKLTLIQIFAGEQKPGDGKISTLKDVDKVKNLTTLYLENTFFTEIGSGNLQSLKELKYLELYNNKLKDFYESQVGGGLVSLGLAAKSFGENNPAMTTENLRHHFPAIWNQKNLTSLSLAYQPMDSLPPELGKLTTLTILNLTGANNLKSLPTNLSKLLKLEHIYIQKTGINCCNPEIVRLYTEQVEDKISQGQSTINAMSNSVRCYDKNQFTNTWMFKCDNYNGPRP